MPAGATEPIITVTPPAAAQDFFQPPPREEEPETQANTEDAQEQSGSGWITADDSALGLGWFVYYTL